MTEVPAPRHLEIQATLLIVLGWTAVLGCVVFGVSIVIADILVPNHGWIADTISDLGAGRYEFIVDIGIYAFSASLVSVALMAAHLHLGGWRWSFGVVGFAALALIVFLVGARNEYGDSDSEGVVIHVYLVYAIGLLMALIPWAMSKGARLVSDTYATVLIAISIVWTISAPVFFFLPNWIDGLYERYLGLIAFAAVITLARLFMASARQLR